MATMLNSQFYMLESFIINITIPKEQKASQVISQSTLMSILFYFLLDNLMVNISRTILFQMRKQIQKR